ncbi:Lysine exporter protein (LYSE/YGGA) [Jonesia denitrificans DSM 20603]|uniref:Lysine exporter protein (LYSE/YGGA) n=1 Tax=Jonesia denitrificans (strain ATCC 14870 / DSM 20603 / BCRC 15368 / CIP 55.134 / JCM 11481 / NBRC 15587 / NCTC 10816 / Prevot 55134) TaxID=471856 RepID=C7QYI7_JONDD|nr:Lysine exporter protein (LYSE/YGGA) [Jonesia denitrificans DSM 20603]SQH19807.1 Arginine exporter protein ArgO [Jonesia denitrificans]
MNCTDLSPVDMLTYVISPTVVLAGLGFGLSLIVAIGAQNAFVLRQGLRREHVGPIVAICVASDVILITAGVAGFGVVVQRAAWIIPVLTVFGSAFLVWYGAGACRRALKPAGLPIDDPTLHMPTTPDALTATGLPSGTVATLLVNDGGSAVATAIQPATDTQPTTGATPGSTTQPVSSTLRIVVLHVLALTYLNPHVYLDTLILMGSVATSYGAARWSFAIGAFLATLTWFTALGYGSRVLTPIFQRPRSWQILDALIGVMMFFLAGRLLFDLFTG